MKNYLLILILVLITFNSFCQEKSEITPFVNPPETNPRFVEDKKLSESENLKSFDKKLRIHFDEYLNNSNLKDSIGNKIYIRFSIDTLGNTKFHKIYPKGVETKYLKKEVLILLNSLPKFIPATQRNKKVNIIYIIPLLKKE